MEEHTEVVDHDKEIRHILINYIMAVRAISEARLLEKFDLIKLEYSLAEELPSIKQYIASINYQLKEYYFKIDESKSQLTGESYYVFITTKQDQFLQTSTFFSAVELEAIKAIIDEIMENGEQFSIGLVNASQKIVSLSNKTLKEANILVSKLVDDGWFILTNEDRVILSIRCLSELRTYLIDAYGIKSESDPNGKLLPCKVCDSFVTLGYKYLAEALNFHFKCFEIYQRQNEIGPVEGLTNIGVPKETVVGYI